MRKVIPGIIRGLRPGLGSFVAAVALVLAIVPAAAQNEIKIEKIDATNLGDGRILFRELDSEKPLDGTHRIIDGYRSEYIVAQFSEGLYNGSYEYHRNNVLREKGAYKQGVRHGLFTQYSLDGKVEGETPVTDGKVDGVVKTYHADGTTESEKGYKNGVEHGPDRRWNRGAEKPSRDHNYFEGKPDGRQYAEISSNTGDYVEVKFFDKGKPTGEFLQTWVGGDVKMRGGHKDGLMDGVWIRVRRDGKIESEQTYAAGKLDGPSKEFFTDNTVSKITMYKAGKRDGVETTYRHEGHRVASEFTYAADEMEGPYRRYNDDEKPTLREEGRMQRGNEVYMKEFYPSGRLRRTRERPTGRGTWTTLESYDSEGNKVEP